MEREIGKKLTEIQEDEKNALKNSLKQAFISLKKVLK